MVGDDRVIGAEATGHRPPPLWPCPVSASPEADDDDQWRSRGVLGVLQPPYSHRTYGAPKSLPNIFSSMSEEEEEERRRKKKKKEGGRKKKGK